MTYNKSTACPAEFADTVPAEWWSAHQLAAETTNEPNWPVIDELPAKLRRDLCAAMKALTGDDLDPSVTYDELVVVPAAVASEHAQKVLTRAEVAEFAVARGLDDPHEIAARLANEGSLRAEAERARIRGLFESDPVPLGVSNTLPFPTNALPPVLADMAVALAAELDVDPGLCAPMALGAISGALCGRVDVQVNEGSWDENGVAYTVIVGESGDYKSPAMRQMVTDPFHRVETELIERWLDVPVESIDEPADEDGSDGEPDPSGIAVVGDPSPSGAPPRLVASDVTPESLAMIMAEQGERMIIADAEGDIFDIISGRYSDNPALGIFLRAHTGETFTVDRKNSGSIRLDRPALTMCVATQASVVQKALSNPRFVEKGLIARIEFAYPESVKSRYRRGATGDRRPVPAEVRAAYTNRITELAVDLFDSPRRTAELTAAAQRRMAQIVTHYKARRYDDEGDLGGELDTWAGKSAARVARRALHLHMAEHGPKGVDLLIEAETVDQAKIIEEWYIGNVKAAFGLASTASTDRRRADVKVEDAKAMVSWLVRTHEATPYQPVEIAKLTANGPKRVRSKGVRDAVLDLLADLHYVVPTKIGKADAIYLNPATRA